MDWEEFQTEFRKDFCPAHLDVAAINRLESTVYYQKNQSLDNYLEEFLDLVTEAGYTDLKGLDPQIQNTIATMAYGRPSDISLDTHTCLYPYSSGSPQPLSDPTLGPKD